MEMSKLYYPEVLENYKFKNIAALPWSIVQWVAIDKNYVGMWDNFSARPHAT